MKDKKLADFLSFNTACGLRNLAVEIKEKTMIHSNNNTTYYINPAYLTFVENSGYGANLIQVSASSSCYIRVFVPGVIGYDGDGNYRRWKITAYNNKFPDNDLFYIYVRLERNGASALIAYSKTLYNIDGSTPDGSVSASDTYYYIRIGEVSATDGTSIREISYDTGRLESDQVKNEGTEMSEMWEMDQVSSPWLIKAKQWLASFTVKGFISLIGGLIFKKGDEEKIITDVKRSVDSDEDVPVSDESLPTTKYIHEMSNDRFLRKDIDDTAHGTITFEKQIKSDDFVPGYLMGAGWSVYRDANGNTVVETDKVIVRQSLTVNELIVNQETFQKGSTIFVKAGCTITEVEEYDAFYRCYYDNEDGNRYSGFKAGDQARCQRYDKSYDEVVKYYWRLVEGVGDDYVDLSKTDCDGTGVPEAGDDIAQLGNRRDKTRQSATVISPDNGGSVVIWANIDSFNLSEKNMVGMGVNPNTGRAYLYGYGDMYFGDRNLEGNFITYQIKNGDTEPTMVINADVQLGTGSNGLSNLSEFKDVQNDINEVRKSVNELGVDFEAIQQQADREFTIWYFDPEPTLENEPAVNWNTPELVALHDQDIYFSDLLARAWRFVDGEWKEITDQRTLAALNIAADAQAAAEEAQKNASSIKNYIDNVLPGELSSLQQQIDGAIESFFYEEDPTLDNLPAVDWVDSLQKEAHLNDTYTNLKTGYSWRWTKDGDVYGWTPITDTATVEALRVASQAQDTADRKRRVFVVTPYTPYDEGDLWVQGEDGDILRCAIPKKKEEVFEETDWVKASKYTDDSALQSFIDGDYKQALEAIQQQVDKRSETWYQAEDPSIQWTTEELKQLHVGDLWFDTNRNQSFMWNGTEWITQGVPDEVFDKIDGKASIFTRRPSEYQRNDLWILSTDETLDKLYKAGTIVIATASSSVFVATHWTKKDSYTDDTEADKANERLEAWASDGSISPVEKTALSQQRLNIQSEYNELVIAADRHGLSHASFANAYLKAMAAFDVYTAAEPENIPIKSDYEDIAAYYNARQLLSGQIDEAVKKATDLAYTKALEAQGKAESLTDEIDGVKVDMDIIRDQTDREYIIWYFDPEPTLFNEPAVNWTTEELKDMHDQDLYFSDSLGRAWRFVDGNWVEITDERTIAALKIAAEAKEIAVEAQQYITNVLPGQLDEIRTQIDGTMVSYFEDYDPTLENEPAKGWIERETEADHVEDTFTNITNGWSWKWLNVNGVYQWSKITDSATANALLKASEAKDTADKKRRVFVVTPYTPYDEGDLWVQGEDGDIMRCKTSREEGDFVSEDWVKASKYTDDTKANEAITKVTDMEYLKDAFGPDTRIIEGGIAMHEVVCVTDEDKEVEAFINGSDFASDETHGKLFLVGGVPAKSASGSTDLVERIKEATTRIYEDGHADMGSASVKGEVRIADGRISLNKDGSGQLANGNIRWTREGITYRKAPDYVEWVKVSSVYEDDYLIDFDHGSYLNIAGLTKLHLPVGLGENRSLYIKYSPDSRSDFATVLHGTFMINGSPATAVSTWDTYQEFELRFNAAQDKWYYEGYYTTNEEGVVLLEKNDTSAAEEPTVTGISKSFNIRDNYGRHSLVFTDGLLTSYEFEDTEGGN